MAFLSLDPANSSDSINGCVALRIDTRYRGINLVHKCVDLRVSQRANNCTLANLVHMDSLCAYMLP